MKAKRILGLAALLAVLVLAAPVAACPSCQEAISAADAEDGPNNLPAAYNASIYLMVGVPYLTLAVGGLLVYRGCKKNALYLQTRNPSEGATSTQSARAGAAGAT